MVAAYGTNVDTFNLASRPLRGISMGISIWQLVIILAIVLVLFGAKRLRGLGSDLGGALKGFKQAMRDDIPAPDSVAARVATKAKESTRV